MMHNTNMVNLIGNHHHNQFYHVVASVFVRHYNCIISQP